MQKFGTIYKKYAPEVFRYAYSLTLERDEAKDITAETFARALTAYDPSRQPTVRAFLFSIAHKLIMDHFRRRKRFEPVDPDELSKEPHFQTQAEDRDLLFKTLIQLQSFTDADRELILLRAQGLTYEEISAALGLSVAACKVRVHRARSKLAEWRVENLEK